MNYIKVSKAAEKWGISARRVRLLCANGKIDGVIRKGNLYMIPENAMKPLDGRTNKKNILLDNQRKRERLSEMRPLTQGEVERLAEEFMIDFTYNSNAIEGNTLTLKEIITYHLIKAKCYIIENLSKRNLLGKVFSFFLVKITC